ncbi:hypothetical protein CIHG_02374 [Coccidioides immitis H538.4]|uniref:Uncharacterized protein n=1 Tax=Coccidioides immitis H538.4 TaxID=396776 RepID=A0A0J8RHH1_COCIT|nr:hypothetical protein CIHG_02374 [Coccidioides immitis H538.4]
MGYVLRTRCRIDALTVIDNQAIIHQPVTQLRQPLDKDRSNRLMHAVFPRRTEYSLCHFAEVEKTLLQALHRPISRCDRQFQRNKKEHKKEENSFKADGRVAVEER